MSQRVPNPSRIRLAFAWALLACYVAVVLVVAFYPTPVDQSIRGLLDRVLDKLHEKGVPEFVDYGIVEFLANVGLFVPIGLLVAIAVPRGMWWITILAGPLFSVSIELLQGALLPDRFATVGDIVANSLGCLIGAILGLMLRMLVAHRDQLVIDRYEYERSARRI